MSPPPVGLPEALERAASALSDDAADIRPANGDPIQLIELLEPDAATRVLVWLLVEELDAGTELALSWAEIPDRASNVLLAGTETGLPKPAKKAIRRALHRMRSAGVEIPQESTATVVARLPSVEEKLDEVTGLSRRVVTESRDPSARPRVSIKDAETGETRWRREAPRPRRTTFHPKNGPTAASAATPR